MARVLLVLSGIIGFSGVALGAFGAHALKSRLTTLADGVTRLEWWHTGTQYLMWHALLLGIMGGIAVWRPHPLLSVAGGLVVAGCLLFSGSLFTMTVTGLRILGAITPLGGLCFLAAWALLAAFALRGQPPA